MTFTEYAGRRVVVTGCSSGIGLATATTLVELGAEVIGLSRRKPDLNLAAHYELDMLSPKSIDHGANEISGRVDALFNCAGATPTMSSLDIVRVNFLGTRLLTERMLERMSSGAGVVSVASSNAHTWHEHVAIIRPFLLTTSYAQGASWYDEHETEAGHGYPFSKEALVAWTLKLATSLISGGIRINVVSPGAVQTPLLEQSERAFPPEWIADSQEPIGRPSRADEQVGPLLFANSNSASYLNGANLAVDGGYTARFWDAEATK